MTQRLTRHERDFCYWSFRSEACLLLGACLALFACVAALADEVTEHVCTSNGCWKEGDALAEAVIADSRRPNSIIVRLAAEQDTAVIERELSSLDLWTLSRVLRELQTTIKFGGGEDKVSALLQVIRSSDVVFSRIVNLLADNRPFGELVLGREDWQRLRETDVAAMSSQRGTELIGIRTLRTILQLISPEQTGRLLSMLTTELRFKHLSEHLAELVELAWRWDVMQVPKGWARERVEAGDKFWLPLLVAEGNVDKSPALMKHIAELPTQWQLSIVVQHPDPGFLPLLVDIHDSALDFLSCTDCADPGYPDYTGRLAAALAGMGMPETIAMLHELIDAAPDAKRGALARSGLGLGRDIHGRGPFGLFRHDSQEARNAIRDVLIRYPDIALDMWDVRSLERAEVPDIRNLVEMRIPIIMDEIHSVSLKSENDVRRWCSSTAVLIVAHDRGWIDPRHDFDEVIPKGEGGKEQIKDCNRELMDAAVVGSHSAGLRALLDLWERLAIEADTYEQLIDQALNFSGGDVEARREVMLDYFPESAIWEDLEPRTQDRLFGLPVISSCNASSDWE